MKGVRPDLAFNTAVSFVTNTNWQSYSPELTMSYLTQMIGLAVQNFASAAVGMAVAVALVRGFVRSESRGIGNFWADLVRGTLYVLLPLALVVGVVLLARGVVQTFDGPAHVQTLAGGDADDRARPVRGPGGDQGARHERRRLVQRELLAPLREPDAVHEPARDLEPAADPVRDAVPVRSHARADARGHRAARRDARSCSAPAFGISLAAETRTTPALTAAGLTHAPNIEGKEQRFSVQEAAIFSVATTGTSTGAVNSMHDSFTAIGGAVPMTMMLLGEVAPGGVGTGLYSILLFATLTVFIAGLMVGPHTGVPGQVDRRARGEARDARRARDAGRLPRHRSGCRRCSHDGLAGPLNAGPHGFSEILYALASAWNNNGSAFAGLTAATNYYDYLLGAAMVLGRFLVILPALGLAGALAAQKTRPASSGSMPTSSPIFVGLLIGVILLVGALSFFPALALGPLTESLTGRLW